MKQASNIDIKQVKCKETGKLLAQWDEKGIYLFCKECHVEHLIVWGDLQRNKMQLSCYVDKR